MKETHLHRTNTEKKEVGGFSLSLSPSVYLWVFPHGSILLPFLSVCPIFRGMTAGKGVFSGSQYFPCFIPATFVFFQEANALLSNNAHATRSSYSGPPPILEQTAILGISGTPKMELETDILGNGRQTKHTSVSHATNFSFRLLSWKH